MVQPGRGPGSGGFARLKPSMFTTSCSNAFPRARNAGHPTFSSCAGFALPRNRTGAPGDVEFLGPRRGTLINAHGRPRGGASGVGGGLAITRRGRSRRDRCRNTVAGLPKKHCRFKFFRGEQADAIHRTQSRVGGFGDHRPEDQFLSRGDGPAGGRERGFCE